MVWMGRDSSASISPPTTSSPSQLDSSTGPRRKKITRTRTGCQTCRDRKVKCGEEKPSCLNCQRTNHVCPGYAPATVFRPQRKGRRESSGSRESEEGLVTFGPSHTGANLSVAPMPMANFEDLKLLHYYTFDLAHTLSLPGAIGRTWSDGVPRLAFEGDHVYLIHALLAAAAAHKVSRNPNDVQSKQRGEEHYAQSLALLQTLDLASNSCETDVSAALAAVMLLTWYESLYDCWENGLVHMRGAANIVREHHKHLLKTPIGRQLIHLFTRLELSASRHRLIDNQLTTTSTAQPAYWESAALDFETLTIDDLSNGNSEFEYAWTGMMKIMVPVTILRMVPRHGDRGTPERKEKGQKIQDTLYDWERNLPVSFMEIEAPDLIMFFDDPILRHLQPVYFGSLNVAVAMAHHSALQINVFTLTHRSDEPRPPSFYDSVMRTLRICVGVQRMRQLGLFQVHDCGDYGILWPLIIAGKWAPHGEIRDWILDLLNDWPREGMIDPLDTKGCLDAMWSRMDQGYGVEAIHKEESFRAMATTGKPVTIEITERSLGGEYRGWLRKVEMTILAEERRVVERPWHLGDIPFQHVSNISKAPPMVLPP